MSETPTWYTARTEAECAAAEQWAEDCAYGHEREGSDAAHEYADGSADVIYLYRSRAIWADSSEVQDWEDYTDADTNADIDQRITECVYYAIADAFASAWQECDDIEPATHVVAWVESDDVVTVGTLDECDDAYNAADNRRALKVRAATEREAYAECYRRACDAIGVKS